MPHDVERVDEHVRLDDTAALHLVDLAAPQRRHPASRRNTDPVGAEDSLQVAHGADEVFPFVAACRPDLVAPLEIRKSRTQRCPQVARDGIGTGKVVDGMECPQPGLRRIRLGGHASQVGNGNAKQATEVQRYGALVRRVISHVIRSQAALDL